MFLYSRYSDHQFKKRFLSTVWVRSHGQLLLPSSWLFNHLLTYKYSHEHSHIEHFYSWCIASKDFTINICCFQFFFAQNCIPTCISQILITYGLRAVWFGLSLMQTELLLALPQTPSSSLEVILHFGTVWLWVKTIY